MRLSPQAIRIKKKKSKIVALTAYDFPTARILDGSGVDLILVGDSLGMVLLGYETTLPVRMEDMMHHTKAVSRAVTRAMVVADMPYGSYDTPEKTVRNAKVFTEECGANAVKLEGGKAVRKQIEALRRAGIPVMGHLGMLPQSIEKLGGYKVQGKKAESANMILSDALVLDRLGVFCTVLECIPAALAKRITRAVKNPTVGIGAGPMTDGQILVTHDLLGFESKVKPRFVRKYADLDRVIRDAVTAYRKDVEAGEFPSAAESY